MSFENFQPGTHVQIRNVSLPSYDWEHATVVRAENRAPVLPGGYPQVGYIIRWAATGDEVWISDGELFPPRVYEPDHADPERGSRTYRFPNGYAALVQVDYVSGRFSVVVLDSEGDTAYDTPGPKGIYQQEPEAGVQEILGRIAAMSSEDA